MEFAKKERIDNESQIFPGVIASKSNLKFSKSNLILQNLQPTPFKIKSPTQIISQVTTIDSDSESITGDELIGRVVTMRNFHGNVKFKKD